MVQLQKTFKESYVKRLRDAVESGSALPLYKADMFEIDETQVKRLANVYAPEFDLGERILGVSELEAAIIVFEAYKDLPLVIAASESFWAYLTHTTCFKYAKKRWSEVESENVKPEYIVDHWFLSSKGILRNAVASLWWGVHNSVDENREDRYELTRILFNNYSFRTNTFGRGLLIRHREAMIGILDFIKDNPEVLSNMELRGRFISLYFNRLGAVRQLAYLDRTFFRDTCERLKDKILTITRPEVLKDPAFYADIM